MTHDASSNKNGSEEIEWGTASNGDYFLGVPASLYDQAGSALSGRSVHIVRIPPKHLLWLAENVCKALTEADWDALMERLEPDPSDFDYAGLEKDLEELERTDPAVGAARDQYEAAKRDIVGGFHWVHVNSDNDTHPVLVAVGSVWKGSDPMEASCAECGATVERRKVDA